MAASLDRMAMCDLSSGLTSMTARTAMANSSAVRARTSGSSIMLAMTSNVSTLLVMSSSVPRQYDARRQSECTSFHARAAAIATTHAAARVQRKIPKIRPNPPNSRNRMMTAMTMTPVEDMDTSYPTEATANLAVDAFRHVQLQLVADSHSIESTDEPFDAWEHTGP